MKHFLTFILLVCTALTAMAFRKQTVEANVDTLLSVRFRQGLAATRAGLYNDALRYWLSYLDLAEANPGKAPDDYVLTAYLAVGSVHFSFEDYESAATFFRKGHEIARENKRETSQIRFLNNLVGTYAELGDAVRSDSCNEAMHDLARRIGEKEYEHNYLFNKGYCARERGNYPEALKYIRASLKQMRKDKVASTPAYAYSELYVIFEALGQLDSALYYLHKFQEVADKPYLQLDCYKGLMRVYTKLGDNEKSLQYQNLYFQVSDSVLNSREFMQTRNSYLFNEQERTQRHIAGLEENLLRWRTGIILVSIVLLLIVIVVLILMRQKRRLNSINADLFERNRELVRLHERLAEEWRSRKSPDPVHEEEPREDSQTEKKDDSDSRKRQDDLLARVIDFMETSDKFLDPEFSLAHLAKELNSNTKYVSQVINERTGNTFRSFINEYRIRVAQERIMDHSSWGHLTIKSIGESVGFKSPANFIAAFKKATGMTPSVYMSISKTKRNEKPSQEPDAL